VLKQSFQDGLAFFDIFRIVDFQTIGQQEFREVAKTRGLDHLVLRHLFGGFGFRASVGAALLLIALSFGHVGGDIVMVWKVEMKSELLK
jgi:hypothetical protein